MRKLAAVLIVLALATAGAVGLAAGPDGLSVAQIALVERMVEQTTGAAAAKWQKVKEGSPLRTGDRLRTSADGVAGIQFPWMTAALGPAASVTFPDEVLLSSVLEQGRVELVSNKRDILKLTTAEAEVRGRGRVVVRREGETTLVMAFAGKFLVEGAGRTVLLPQGKGTIVRSKSAPLAPSDLAAPPEGLWPGADPVYANQGEKVSFTWKSAASAHLVEVLPVGSELILMQRDVGASPWKTEIPWTGAFRWRVSLRDQKGLEGMPAEGLVCVVEK